MVPFRNKSTISKYSNFLHYIVILIVSIAGSAVLYKQFMGSTSSHSMSPPVKVQPKEKATASLIFLHGLGDTGHGWAEQFKECSFKHIRCIFPHAPQKPVTLNAGMVMPSWFDIKGLTPNSPEDEHGIKEACKELQHLIAKEVNDGIAPERIVVGGFSQGGSVALYTTFATNTKVGGVVALSTWIPMNKHFTNQSNNKYNTEVPVLQCHGLADPLVPHRWGQATHEIIKSFNSKAQFKSYSGMGHSSCAEEMEDVRVFLVNLLTDS
uniref:palmitoyl-protein hydrolase n=1 Tax=Arion vulgaris TaxID=1028688 RepID=A0A0B6ZUX0_9EUPU